MVHTVHVGREGKWWTLAFPDLGPDAVSQARRVADVDAEARDYLAVTLDVPPSSVDVEIVFDDIGVYDLQARSERILEARRRIAQLEAEVAKETAALAEELSRADVPMRDIASLVGVSFQRVGQLI